MTTTIEILTIVCILQPFHCEYQGMETATFKDESVTKPRSRRKLLAIIVIIAVGILLFLLGFLIGYFVPKDVKAKDSPQETDSPSNFHQQFQGLVSKDELEANLR